MFCFPDLRSLMKSGMKKKGTDGFDCIKGNLSLLIMSIYQVYPLSAPYSDHL